MDDIQWAFVEDLSFLIKRAQNGDKDAFGSIYSLFYRRIFRYCKFNVREGAQDLCQETFLRAYKALPSFKETKGGSFQAYLFRIARNLIIDEKRKKKDVPLEDWFEIESEENLEDIADKKTDSKRVHNALSLLKDKERQIIVLRYFEEMTTYEVAQVVGMREGALRVRSHRILQKLKLILEKDV